MARLPIKPLSEKENTPREDSFLFGINARMASLFFASSLAMALLVYPPMVAKTAQALNHTTLMLSLCGISSGFVHGVGFVAEHRVWRWVFWPPVSWALMLYTLYLWIPLNSLLN